MSPAKSRFGWKDHAKSWFADAERVEAELWRGVEAQHKVSTMPLVDSTYEQGLLEEMLEQSKPPLPAAARKLHYLIGAPFRYASRWPSRFRTQAEPGVWYGAHRLETAAAEVAYWRWRFVRDSDAFQARPVLTEHTFYRAQVDGRAVDLSLAPWNAWRTAWMDPDDYSACQALARQARDAGIEWVRYSSVRDPQQGLCGAVFEPTALSVGDLTEQLTWASAVRGDQVSLVPTGLASPYRPLDFHFGLSGGGL